MTSKGKYLMISVSVVWLQTFGFVISIWLGVASTQSGGRLNSKSKSIIQEVAKIPSNILGFFSWVGIRKLVEPKSDKYPEFDRASVVPKKSSIGRFSVLVSRIGPDGVSNVEIDELNGTAPLKLFDGNLLKKSSPYTDELSGSELFRSIDPSGKGRIVNPLLLPDKTVVFNLHKGDLVAVNQYSQSQKWRVRGSFHHSVELIGGSNIVACASVLSRKRNNSRVVGVGDYPILFEDNAVVFVNLDGKITDTIRISDLLTESNSEFLIYGVSNPEIIQDPFHVNQISFSNSNFQGGNGSFLLISLRNISTILLYNLSERRVEWVKTGPWMNQHSVFQLNKNQYYLFDNHSFASARPESQWQEAFWETKLIVCRYLNGGVDKEQIVIPRILKLKVPTEGRIYNVSDKLWFFEDSSAGIFMLFEDNEVRYLSKNLDQNGQTLPFSWCRPFLKTTLP